MNTMKVRVRVTKNDIRNAANNIDGYDEYSCPIARSIMRVVDCKKVLISSADYMIVGGMRLDMPRWARKFVTTFDNLVNAGVYNMRPRRRTLELPAKFLKRLKKG